MSAGRCRGRGSRFTPPGWEDGGWLMRRLGNAPPSRRRGRRRAACVSALLMTSTLAACSSESGTPTLTWYINPDNGGQAKLATKCGDASNGAYKIETQVLPNDADQQRE